jgi:hypothetical protein
MVLPVCVGAGTVAALGFSKFGVGAAIFWAVVTTKLLDEMLRGAFLIPVLKILCQPLPDRERLRVQAVRDSIVEPFAIGFSGFLLLVLTQAAFQRNQLLWILLLVLAVFAVLGAFLRKQYIRILEKSLPGHSDSADVEILARGLDSRDPDEVIRSFTLIEQANPLAAKLYLPQILKHAVPEVRLFGLRQIRETRETRAAGLVHGLLETEQIPSVKSEALSTLSILNEGKSARRDAESDDWQVSRGL